MLAEATASGDADLESGRGIGFDAYLENVSGSIFFDGFILGEQDPQEAGWGTHHLCDFVSRDENDDDIFYIWDFQYALGHPGMRGPFTTTVDGTEVQYYEYDFPLASSFHTYEMDHQSYTTNPDPSDLTGRTVQSQNTFSLDIQDTNTNGFDYIDVNQSQSKTFYLTPSEHRDWVDNNWGQKASRDEWKEKHIEEEGSDLLWETFFTVAGGVAGFLIGGPVGGAAGTAIGGLPIVSELTSDDCGRDETAQDEFHEIVWEYCERTPLTGHIVQLTIKVPANETVEAVVESQVGSDDAYPAVNTGQWRIEITGGQASTSLLSSEPICNR